MKPRRIRFQVNRNGTPIRDAGLKDSINTGISYAMMFGEWEACVENGLDLWKWYSDEYPREFKIRVIAFNNMRKAVHSHSEDAVASYSEKKRKK